MKKPSSASRLIVALVLSTSISSAYSVLTHEAIVDTVWDSSIQKLLMKRFPNTTPEELKDAHAYVYGGCILQDMGYYPFSSHFFSDLTHYVRSGDFILAMIKDSADVNEYAFALGALAHYAADNSGHRIATNVSVPLLYPKLRRKFGKTVTYWDDPTSHLRTEFSFDVLQVAKGRYAPDQYRSFIGFQVSKPLLERALPDTYSLETKDIFANLNLALGSYRFTVSNVIPEMTRVAWQTKKDELTKEIPGITRKKFLYNISRASYEKEFGKDYHKPGIFTRFLAWIFRILPRWGPLKTLGFKPPTPEVEKLFMASFNATVDNYKALLANVEAGQLQLANLNFDLGEPAEFGKYKGADETYAKLVDKLAERKFAGVAPDLRANILDYYKNLNAPTPPRNKKEAEELAKLRAELDELNHLQPATAARQ